VTPSNQGKEGKVRIQGEERREARQLQQKVEEDGEGGIDGKGDDGRHSRQAAYITCL